MSTRTTISPTESELTRALTTIKAANPQMGIAKVHVLLLSTYPGWLVSEKRTRKVLQGLGLIVGSGAGSSAGAGPNSATASGVHTSGDGDATNANLDPPEPPIYPSSRVIGTLDTYLWTPKVRVRYFDQKKGKGLIASHAIAEGEIIWREDPFIVAPEWYACHFCPSCRFVRPASNTTLCLGKYMTSKLPRRLAVSAQPHSASLPRCSFHVQIPRVLCASATDYAQRDHPRRIHSFALHLTPRQYHCSNSQGTRSGWHWPL